MEIRMAPTMYHEEFMDAHTPSDDDLDLYNLMVLDRPLKDHERLELFRLSSTTGEDTYNGARFD